MNAHRVARLKREPQVERVDRFLVTAEAEEGFRLTEVALAPVPSELDDLLGVDERTDVVARLEVGRRAVREHCGKFFAHDLL
jgi:hypothetical protein